MQQIAIITITAFRNLQDIRNIKFDLVMNTFGSTLGPFAKATCNKYLKIYHSLFYFITESKSVTVQLFLGCFTILYEVCCHHYCIRPPLLPQ